MTRKSTLAVAVAVAAVLSVAPGLAAAQVFTYSGFLKRANGAPETAATTVNFRLWDAATGGTVPLWAEPNTVTPGADGYFSVLLGATTSLGPVDFSAPIWLELQVQGEVAMTPRVPLTDAPRAAAVAFSRVTGFPASSCASTQAITGIGTNGQVTCGPKPSMRSTGWLQAAYGTGTGWANNTGVGNFQLSAPGDTASTWYAYVTAVDGPESQHAAIQVYADCTHSPSAAGGVPQCRGATQLPFSRRVTNGANTFDLEFRYAFATDTNFAQWVMIVVAPRGVVSGSLDLAYIQDIYLPNLKFRGVVLSAQ